MSEEHHEPTFQGPIESGKTAKLPETPGPGTAVVHKDHFELEGLDIDQQDVKSIVLPKYILNDLNPGVGYNEKGFLLFTFNGNHKNGVYREIIKTVCQGKKGVKDIKIHYLDEQTGDVVSTWTFTKASVHAIDFGYTAHVRGEPTEFSVEFDYDKFDIDGFSI